MPVIDYGHDYAQWYGSCWVLHNDVAQRVAAVVGPDGVSYRERRITKEDDVRFVLTNEERVRPADVVYTMPELLGARRRKNTDQIYLVSRVGARQWKRGVHQRTLRVAAPRGLRYISRYGGGNEANLSRVASEVFTPGFDDVGRVHKQAACVLTQNVWTFHREDVLLLGYGEYIVGKIDDAGPLLYRQARHLQQVMEDVFTTMEVRVE